MVGNKITELIKSKQKSKEIALKEMRFQRENRKLENHRNGPCLVQAFQKVHK